MPSLGEYYVSQFGAEGTYGLGSIFPGVIALIALVWMTSLSLLVWRAAPKEMDNRFIAILLIAEGLKASYMIPSLLPADHFDWWWLSQYTILFRGLIFQTAHIVSILMYLCFPIYFRVNILKFLYRPALQKHAWYLPLILTTAYMGIQILQNNPAHVTQNFAFIECSAVGAAPTLEVVVGSQIPIMDDLMTSIGTCEGVYSFPIANGGEIGFLLVALSYLISILALFVMRTSMKEYNKSDDADSSKSLTSRSLYIGFLGKVIGTTLFFLMLFFITPMLNPIEDGPNLFVDSYTVAIMEATLQGKLFGYSMIVNGYLLSLPIAFEAMMFVHAMMKDTVFGIDERLRKTFSTAILTGAGAILFLIGSEAVEGLLPFPGVVGGVLLGGTILLVRKPIVGIADRFSGRILVSSYSETEATYLESYSAAMQDNIVTEQERVMLNTLAKSLQISEEKVAEIEQGYDKDSTSEKEVSEPPAGDTQWTDEQGHTWLRRPDGSTFWWNGSNWQKV
jgi:hypothetical protein